MPGAALMPHNGAPETSSVLRAAGHMGPEERDGRGGGVGGGEVMHAK